jgi:hypothetical protein
MSKNPQKIKAQFSNGVKQVKTRNGIHLASMANIALALMNTDEFFTRK